MGADETNTVGAPPFVPLLLLVEFVVGTNLSEDLLRRFRTRAVSFFFSSFSERILRSLAHFFGGLTASDATI